MGFKFGMSELPLLIIRGIFEGNMGQGVNPNKDQKTA